jgi:hypothetical protein
MKLSRRIPAYALGGCVLGRRFAGQFTCRLNRRNGLADHERFSTQLVPEGEGTTVGGQVSVGPSHNIE